MTTTLIFLRHAKPSKEGYRLDCTKALSEEGVKIQREQTKKLKERGYQIDHIYCSPLKRALETAHIVQEFFEAQLTIQEALNHPFDPIVLLHLIPEIKQNKTILYIGHAPTLAEFARSLAKVDILPQGLSKSGMVVLRFHDLIDFKQAEIVEELAPDWTELGF